MGGLHGNERATVLVLESFMEHCIRPGWNGGKVLVVPLANPDGFEQNSRYNARGVDLNRNGDVNWSSTSVEPPGPAPWSEPESRAIRDLILAERPERIVFLHWALAEIDADGAQSTDLAFAMWHGLTVEQRAPYRIRVWEHAPGTGFTTEVCPGSFGQWCGYALRYPDGTAPAMITLELPYDPSLPRPEVLPDDHLGMLRETWNTNAAGYMAAIEPAVHRMLMVACWGVEDVFR